MIIRSSFVLLLSLLMISLPIHAEDLGSIGPTYEIIERDLIEVIQDKFRRMDKSGELSKMQEDYKRQVISAVERPKAVRGIRATETARTFYIDPTWTLDRNVVDEKGRVLFPAGTKVNPFDYDKMSKTLLFFDARSKEQVAFAKRFMAESKMLVKPILVGGEPLKLMREWKREIFYDQGGRLRGASPLPNLRPSFRRKGKSFVLMRFACKALCAIGMMVVLASAKAATCKGKFANPITDICWSCMFPLYLGSATLASMDQEDTPNPGGNPACFCGNPPKLGMKVSFWEPVRRVDVVRDPFCMVSLGGIKMDPGFDAPVASHFRRDGQDQSSFYQVHWYVDPLIYYLQAVLDNSCLENQGFDVAYLTELDPLWKDDELTRILNPDVYLFGNLPARAACAADCVSATAGFPNNTFFWCAGCQGSLYPLNGNIQAHVGGVQASSLEVYRITAKLHREMLMWAASGEDGMCGYYPQPVLDKTGYKYHMLYPVPQTKKIAGKCCQPLGRSTALWGAGREFPFEGEDFAYQIFRKRNCCQGAVSLGN